MRWIREARAALREWKSGRRRKAGWRLLAALAAFYLIRDLFLYVALPALAWSIAAR